MLAALATGMDAPSNEAVVPVPRTDAWGQQRHEAMNARVKQGNVDLIFIGDSITQLWEESGKEVWPKFYGHRHAVNLGVGGNRTQHVLWRLDHGNIDGISPKLAVLLIGVNNSYGGQSADQIAEGIEAIVKKLRAKLPNTKVLLLGIFPCGHFTQNQTSMKNNEIISKLADGKNVFYLDICSKFLAADGTLGKGIMPDRLHLNAEGYAIWAEAIEPMVAKLMGEK